MLTSVSSVTPWPSLPASGHGHAIRARLKSNLLHVRPKSHCFNFLFIRFLAVLVFNSITGPRVHRTEGHYSVLASVQPGFATAWASTRCS